MQGIYLIKNLINNKIYIGSAISIKRRWIKHKNELKNKIHHSTHLQNAWNIYGKENFLFEILELVDDKKKIIEKEQYYLDLYKCYDRNYGYNILEKAYSPLGTKHTEESKEKMRKNASKHWLGVKKNEIIKKKISDKLKGDGCFWYGKEIPKEIKEKIRKSQQGENSHSNKLKEFQVLEILEKYNTGNQTIKQLSNEYNVGKTTISNILNGKKWKFLNIKKNSISKFIKKLNENDVLKIRELYSTGLYTQKNISLIYNVNVETISLIIRNKTWKHI